MTGKSLTFIWTLIGKSKLITCLDCSCYETMVNNTFVRLLQPLSLGEIQRGYLLLAEANVK